MDPGTRQPPATAASPTIAPEVLEAITAPRAPDAPRRCFICLTDQEPTDNPSDWVDPCPCTLEAHQDCMLSWVTDCERSNKPLKCPVCKYNIELAGPWDPVVALNDHVQRRFTRASPFLLATGLSIGIQFSLQMYGAVALWTFSGRDVLFKFVLGPAMVIDGSGTRGLGIRPAERITNTLQLMSIGPALLLGQLLPSLGNKIFLPIASFYGLYHIMHDGDFLSWPPSPQLAMAAFPYVRSMYYNLWREFVLPHEIKLNRQIQGLPPLEPRPNATNNAGNRDRAAEAREADGGLMGIIQGLADALDPDDEHDGEANQGGGIRIVHEEVEVEGDGEDGDVLVELIIEDVVADGMDDDNEGDGEQVEFQIRQDNDPAAPPLPPPLVDAAPRVRPPAAGQAPPANPAPQQPDAPGHEAPPPPPARRPGLGSILSNMSNALTSALILPGISFFMGEMLSLVLPRSWTVATPVPWHTFGRARPGLLQQQWGRSLVGGCLFVVMRDAVRFYAKHRKVISMNNRQVKNVQRRRNGRG